MAIFSGTVLGPYKIPSAIGAGGMGEVCQARDTQLGPGDPLPAKPDNRLQQLWVVSTRRNSRDIVFDYCPNERHHPGILKRRVTCTFRHSRKILSHAGHIKRGRPGP